MKKIMFDSIMVILGNFILALAVHVFILPYEILTGGVAGIAIAVSKLTGFSSNMIISILILILYVLGSLFLGKKFTIHTMASTLLYPFFLNLLNRFDLSVNTLPILASLYGGGIAGVGIGLTFRVGASTGGMDVPPLIIHKYTNIDLTKLVLTTDILTVLLGWYVFNIEAVLVGFISVYASSFMIKKVMVFGDLEAYSVMIISNKYQEIIKKIHIDLDRGSTILQGKGSFSQNDKPVILSVITKTQYPLLVKLCNEIDPHAFIIVNDAHEIKGNGFSFDFKV
jgi:uncharacterized membrane-anchored protein YitT (DUF2179 family)